MSGNLRNWIKKLSDKMLQSDSYRLRSAIARRPRTMKLLCEALEDRITPSNFTVTDPSDIAGSATDVTLRYAVNTAVNGDTITFAPSVTLITVGTPLTVGTNVNITGPGAGALAVSGGGTTQVFTISSSTTASISGLTVEYGTAASGGGIHNAGTLTLSSVAFSGNTGGDVGNASGATLIAGDAYAFASTTNLNNNGTLDLNGNSNSIGTLNGAATGSIIDSGAAATLTVTGGGTFGGNITGANTALTVDGATQTLTLLGNDTYSGPTTITTGNTLLAASTTALSATSDVSDSGTLSLGGYSNSIGALTGSGTVNNSLHNYQIDNGSISDVFNNTLINECEDNWVGNVFTAAPTGTVLQSASFYTDDGALNSTTLPNPEVSVALYTGAAGAGFTLVADSVNTVTLNANSGSWITVPFATPQIVAPGQVFTAAFLIDNVPLTFDSNGNIVSPSVFPFSQDTSGSSTNSYYDVSSPPGNVNTYNLAEPNGPVTNGSTYPGTGGTNANVDTTILRVDYIAQAATLTVTGGGSFSGNIQNGSGHLALTVAGTTQTLTLSGTDTYSGLTTINTGDTLLAASTTALSATSSVSDSGILSLGGYSNSIGALTGTGTVNNTLHNYQIDNGSVTAAFNNTLYTEDEDNWVANVFTAAPTGTVLQSASFYASFYGPLNGTTLPNPDVSVALYTGAPGSDLTLVASSVGTVTLNASADTWVTVPFATPQIVAPGQVFTVAFLIDDVPGSGSGIQYPWSEDTSGSNTNSYFDDNAGAPTGTPNTYDLSSPVDPTPNGENWGSSGSTNAYVDTTLLRVDYVAQAATLTVTGGGSFSGNVQDGSGPLGLTVAGTTQTLALSGTDTYSGPTTINAGDTLQAGSTTAFSASSDVTDTGTLDLDGFSNSIGALNDVGTVLDSAAAATLTVTNGGTFSGNVQDGSGPLGLTVAGATQTLALSGTDTYSGLTTINAGDTLQAGSITAFSASSDVTDTGTLDLDGFSNSIGALNDVGTVLDSAAAATLTVTNGGTFSGTVQDGSGPLALTVAGTATTLTLSGSDTYTGQTTVNSTDTLLVNGSEISPVAVQGTLGGTGATSDLTVSGGTVNPGSPVSDTGTLSADSADFSSAGNLTVDITGSFADRHLRPAAGHQRRHPRRHVQLDRRSDRPHFHRHLHRRHRRQPNRRIHHRRCREQSVRLPG